MMAGLSQYPAPPGCPAAAGGEEGAVCYSLASPDSKNLEEGESISQN